MWSRSGPASALAVCLLIVAVVALPTQPQRETLNPDVYVQPNYFEGLAKQLEKEAESANAATWWRRFQMKYKDDLPYRRYNEHLNLDEIGGGNLVKRNLDAIGGGNLVKRNLDAIGGGNLVKRANERIAGLVLVRPESREIAKERYYEDDQN